MPFWESLLIFGIFTILGLLSFYLLRPFLAAHGASGMMAYLLSLAVPLGLMLITALVSYRLEGNPWNWEAFSERFRLRRLPLKGWLLGIGVGIVMLVSSSLLMLPLPALLESGILTLPADLPPMLDPTAQQSLDVMRTQLASEGPAFAIIAPIVLLINIFGEELLWRGYVLPRQELTHGRHTWIVQGLLWTIAHLFQWWLLLAILPGALALCYVAQRQKNTWPGIIAHFINNAAFMVAILRSASG
jgi:membrane protease YdiL (CAAX protease family)